MSNLMEIHDLHVEMDGHEFLRGVNLEIPHGEVHTLLGPNGSGKTSLLMTIMGFSGYKVTKGKIIFDGIDITYMNVTERARLGIGLAQQRPATISGVKLKQILEYTIQQHPESADIVDNYINQANMTRFLDREINAGLSGGEIRRAELLQMLASNPKFAMLDEPDSGVDVEALKMVGKMANDIYSINPERPAKRRGGLIITHTGEIMDYVHADRAHILMDGKVSGCGNANIIFNTVRQHGYSNCIECIMGRGAA
jgi:Fe-S cluster assembly ATP-binding protein